MLIRWLRYLLFNEDGFFGIGQGPSKQEKQQYSALGDLASFATSQGEGDISTADNFWKSILSGDPTKIAQVLGPQTSAINKQGQEQKKTASEFHNRGGGTNAFEQTSDASTRTTYDSMISDLVGKGASALGASGAGLLSAGVSAHDAAFSAANTIQQQHSAQMNDLFKSIASFAAAPFTGGASLAMGDLKLPGGGGAPAEDPTSFDGVPAI